MCVNDTLSVVANYNPVSLALSMVLLLTSTGAVDYLNSKINAVVLWRLCYSVQASTKVPEDCLGTHTRVTPCTHGPRCCSKPVRCHSCIRHSTERPGPNGLLNSSFFFYTPQWECLLFVHMPGFGSRHSLCCCISTFQIWQTRLWKACESIALHLIRITREE